MVLHAPHLCRLQYGCNLVPVEPEQKADYRFPTDKGMQVGWVELQWLYRRHVNLADAWQGPFMYRSQTYRLQQ